MTVVRSPSTITSAGSARELYSLAIENPYAPASRITTRSPAAARGSVRSAARMSPVSHTFPAISTFVGSAVLPITRTRWYA